MVIGINGYEAVIPRFGYESETGLPRRVGSGEYCFELLVSFYNQDRENQYLIYLPQSPASDMPKERDNWHYKIIRPRKMWTLFGLSLEFLLKKSRVDVFFSPTHYLPIVSPKKSVISILDISYIRYPELFRKSDLEQLTKWTRYSVGKAVKIFTISQASKDDILNQYHIPDDKVVVTYPGVKLGMQNSKFNPFGKLRVDAERSRSIKMQNSKLLNEKYGIEGKYILFVGTLQPRKNIVRLIEAFSKIKNDTRLVIVGKKGWLYEDILGAPREFGIEDKVKFLGFVPDEDLAYFYKDAICFILPSLYEGFGLPVLEAMKYGCPVITSNTSSLPEAGGDAALYIDPLNVDDIRKNLELIITNSELRKKLIEKGYKQVKKFSWEKTARETLKTLESIK